MSNTVSLLEAIFDPVTSISIADDVAQVPVVLISFSAMLLLGSETTS
jgi:hypothetical protein